MPLLPQPLGESVVAWLGVSAMLLLALLLLSFALCHILRSRRPPSLLSLEKGQSFPPPPHLAFRRHIDDFGRDQDGVWSETYEPDAMNISHDEITAIKHEIPSLAQQLDIALALPDTAQQPEAKLRRPPGAKKPRRAVTLALDISKATNEAGLGPLSAREIGMSASRLSVDFTDPALGFLSPRLTPVQAQKRLRAYTTTCAPDFSIFSEEPQHRDDR